MVFEFLFVCFVSWLMVWCVFGSIERFASDALSPSNFLIFQPQNTVPDDIVNLHVNKGNRHVLCHIETQHTSSSKIVIYAHNTSENLLTAAHFTRELSEHLQSDVITFDYESRKSTAYDRSLDGMRHALQLVIDHAKETGFTNENIILIGNGIGATLVSDIAVDTTYHSCVLINPITDFHGLVEDNVRSTMGNTLAIQFSQLFDGKWSLNESFSKLKLPLLIIYVPQSYMTYSLFVSTKQMEVLKRTKPELPIVVLPTARWKDQVDAIESWIPSVQKIL